MKNSFLESLRANLPSTWVCACGQEFSATPDDRQEISLQDSKDKKGIVCGAYPGCGHAPTRTSTLRAKMRQKILDDKANQQLADWVEKVKRNPNEVIFPHSVIILAEPRTGSTWLASMVSALTNKPLPVRNNFKTNGELLNQRFWKFPESGGYENVLRYYRLIMLGSDVNHQATSVIKLQAGMIQDLCRFTGLPYPKFVSLIDTLFPESRYVRIRRRDKAAQAVSLHAAEQTQKWQSYHGGLPSVVELQYSYPRLKGFLSNVVYHADSLYGLFEAQHPVHDIWYEDLVADRDKELLKLCEFLGCEFDVSKLDSVREQKIHLFEDEKRGLVEQFQKGLESELNKPHPKSEISVADSHGVSVCIPCRNAAPHVSQAIESVLAQEGVKEILFVDDNSQDKSVDIARNYEPRIKVLSRNYQRGPVYIRNLMIEMSSGRYLQFLDADDFLLPDKIKTHIEHLQKQPSARVWFTNYKVLHYDKGNLISESVREFAPEGDGSWIFSPKNEYLPQTNSFFFDRELFEMLRWRHDGVDEMAILIEMLKHGIRPYHVPFLGSAWRRGWNRNQLSLNWEEQKQAYRRLLEDYRDFKSCRG